MKAGMEEFDVGLHISVYILIKNLLIYNVFTYKFFVVCIWKKIFS